MTMPQSTPPKTLKTETIMDNQILTLLTEIRDSLAQLVGTAEERRRNAPKVITKAKAAELAGVCGTTIKNWSREYSGFRVGRNKYSVEMLGRILTLKGREDVRA